MFDCLNECSPWYFFVTLTFDINNLLNVGLGCVSQQSQELFKHCLMIMRICSVLNFAISGAYAITIKKKPTGLSQWHGQHFSLSSQGNCSSRGKKEKNRSFSLYTVVFLQPFWLEVKAWLKLFENTHKIRICVFVLMYHDLTDNHVFKQNIHVPYYRFYLLNLFSYVYLLHWRESIIALQSKEKKNHTSTI